MFTKYVMFTGTGGQSAVRREKKDWMMKRESSKDGEGRSAVEENFERVRVKEGGELAYGLPCQKGP